MTEEEKQHRREYKREWARQHPEKLREYRKNQLRRAALAVILAERQEEESDSSEGGQNRTKEGMAV